MFLHCCTVSRGSRLVSTLLAYSSLAQWSRLCLFCIRLSMMYIFHFFLLPVFFSCLSSLFVFLLSHPQERMDFLCGRMLSLPFWRVCAPFGTCVLGPRGRCAGSAWSVCGPRADRARTAQVAHACIWTHSCCSGFAFFLRLSLE